MFPEVNSDKVKKTLQKMKKQRMSSIGVDYKLIRDDDYLIMLENYYLENNDKKTDAVKKVA